MRLIGAYLKMYRKGFCLFVLFALLFAGSFALYDLPLDAVRYPVWLCGACGGVFIVVDFAFFYRKHRTLSLLLNEITVTVDSLPAPDSILDEDYAALIRAVHEEKKQVTDALEKRYRDMADYYTIWVHQIKTPLAAIRLLLQLPEERIPKDVLQVELMEVEQYVEMVLNYLRLDSESTDYVVKEYALDGIVRPAVRKYATQFISRQLHLTYGPLNCTVLTDEKWLLFVVEQILSNAVKYTPSGGISIYMDRDEDHVLCIRDTGIGISPVDLPRIFEKGYTGCNGREETRSTGIGLYLCRRILTKLGHTIRITSEVGVGTIVRIDLHRTALEVE